MNDKKQSDFEEIVKGMGNLGCALMLLPLFFFFLLLSIGAVASMFSGL